MPVPTEWCRASVSKAASAAAMAASMSSGPRKRRSGVDRTGRRVDHVGGAAIGGVDVGTVDEVAEGFHGCLTFLLSSTHCSSERAEKRLTQHDGDEGDGHHQ